MSEPTFTYYIHNICTHGDRPPGQGGEAGINPARLPALLERLTERKPQLIVFCESNGDYAQQVADTLGYVRVPSPRTGISELQILVDPARFTVEESYCHDPIPGRSAFMWARLRSTGADGQPLLVMAYHGSLTQDLRLAELKIMQQIAARQGVPTLYMGDFNFQPDAEEYAVITRDNDDAAHAAPNGDPGYTWHGWPLWGNALYDYCFFDRRYFRALSHEILPQLYHEVILSDHCAVCGTMAVTEPGE